MTTVLLVIHVIITVSLVGTILLQKSGADGLAGMGGGGGNFMSGRGAANLLTKTTAILATLFIINSLVLGIIANRSEKPTSVIERIQDIAPKEMPQTEQLLQEEIKEAEPAVPFAE